MRRGTDPPTQILYRSPGTLSKLYVRVTANSNVGSVTLRVRKNGANGNMFVTIPAGATGAFEDTVNTDTVAAGDKLNYQSTTGGATGTMSKPHVLCL